MQAYFTYLVILLPLIGQYGFITRSISVAEILMLIPLVMSFIKFLSTGKLKIEDKCYFLFALWFLLSAGLVAPLVSGYTAAQTWLTSIQNLFYFLVVLLAAEYYFSYSMAVPFYRGVVKVCSTVVLIQQALFMTIHYIGPWVINSRLFPTIYAREGYFNRALFVPAGTRGYRPASLFTEPAMFAQYAAPCLAILLLDKKKTKSTWVEIGLITLSMLIARSANGMIYLLAVWGTYLVKRLYQMTVQHKRRLTPIACVGWMSAIVGAPLCLAAMVYKAGGFMNLSLVQRLMEIFDVRQVSSGSMRVMRGWHIYGSLTPLKKLIGLGNGTVVPYLDDNPMVVPMMEVAYNGYMSGLSLIFVCAGLVGGILFLVWCWHRFAGQSLVSKGMVLFFLAYTIGSSAFHTPIYTMTVILLIYMPFKDCAPKQLR